MYKLVNTDKILQILYKDICNIYEYRNIKEGSITKQELVCIKENVPCKMSFYNSATSTSDNKKEIANCTLNQKIKIFLQKDIKIKAGSMIEIIRNEDATLYKNSSKALIYSNHQEIMLSIYNEKS